MKCNICNKESNYNGVVCLVEFEFNFCKKHYLEFRKLWTSYRKKIKIPKTLVLFTTYQKYSRKVCNAEYQLEEWFCLDYIERNKFVKRSRPE